MSTRFRERNRVSVVPLASRGYNTATHDRSYRSVTRQPKGQILERIRFLTLVQRDADAGPRSNLRVYSFHNLKPCCPPLTQMHTGPGVTVYSL